MKRNGPTTAAELMEQLQADPKYQERKATKDAEIEQLEIACSEDEAGLVSELNELGLRVSSVWDLVNNEPHPLLRKSRDTHSQYQPTQKSWYCLGILILESD